MTSRRQERRKDDTVEVNDQSLSQNLHIYDVHPAPSWFHAWELRRPEWVQECFGEFFGVFFYCYAGLGATCALTVGVYTEQPHLGNLLTVGLGYAMGIVFALTVCAMSSGGHFNPAVTIAFAVFRDFPLHKVPRYILFQLLGGFVATLVVYGQYRPYILEIEEGLIAAGKESVIFSAQGTAGIFAIYANPGVSLRWTFMNEFFADMFIGFVIWGVLDPSNIFVSPQSGTFLVAMAYAVVVWAFVPATVATNAARDLGCRLGAIAIWGTRAWGGSYAALSALTSIPATLFAATLYELFLSDSSRVVTRAAREVITNADKHREHKAWKYNLRRERALSDATGKYVPNAVEIEKTESA